MTNNPPKAAYTKNSMSNLSIYIALKNIIIKMAVYTTFIMNDFLPNPYFLKIHRAHSRSTQSLSSGL